MVAEIIGYLIVALLAYSGFAGAYKQYKPEFRSANFNKIDRILYSLFMASAAVFALVAITFLSRHTWLAEEVGTTAPAVWLIYTGAPALLLLSLRWAILIIYKHDRLA